MNKMNNVQSDPKRGISINEKLCLQFESMEFFIHQKYLGKMRRKAKRFRNFTGKCETWILVPVLLPICHLTLGKVFQWNGFQF